MDENISASLKALLANWAQERQQCLLDQVMRTWQESLARTGPDDALIERLLATLPAEPEPAPPVVEDAGDPGALEDQLGTALAQLERSSTQGEVLKQLLHGLAPFAERGALFVVKQGIATLYAHRGCDGETPRTGTPVVPPPELEELIQGRTPLIQAPGPAYSALLAPLSRFEATDLRILPLSLRHKTVAILLVDSGLAPAVSHPQHVRALTYVAEARLHHLAGSKEEPRTAPAEARPNILTQLIPDPIAEGAAPPLDARVRTNAERSARVLVGDLELYFPAKVTQGQTLGNLYSAMRDELDRSRHSFVERYGAELESQHQIFYQTVVQQLCQGDPTRLGPAPWAPR